MDQIAYHDIQKVPIDLNGRNPDQNFRFLTKKIAQYESFKTYILKNNAYVQSLDIKDVTELLLKQYDYDRQDFDYSQFTIQVAILRTGYPFGHAMLLIKNDVLVCALDLGSNSNDFIGITYLNNDSCNTLIKKTEATQRTLFTSTTDYDNPDRVKFVKKLSEEIEDILQNNTKKYGGWNLVTNNCADFVVKFLQKVGINYHISNIIATTPNDLLSTKYSSKNLTVQQGIEKNSSSVQTETQLEGKESGQPTPCECLIF